VVFLSLSLSLIVATLFLNQFFFPPTNSGSADDKEEALEYKCRETGYVSCEMCEFYGYSLKDLVTHFSSDEHLEEVSISLLLNICIETFLLLSSHVLLSFACLISSAGCASFCCCQAGVLP